MALIQCSFFSDVLGLQTAMCVILPEPPADQRVLGKEAGTRRHPTLYLLHGRSDDHTIWQRRTSIERHVAPLDLAVVMPAVHRSFYTDMAHGYRYWTFVSEELPAVARSLFPLSGERAETFVAGLSMGGYGAFKLALTHPDRYAAAASLSGALDVARLIRDADEAGRAEATAIFGDLSAVAGSGNDLFHLAEQLTRCEAPRPRLYQWCGTEDVLYADNLRFRAHTQALGLELTHEEGPGTHEWLYWDRQIQRVLAWLPLEQ
jgi:S-formylglutathione hydrolase FrmB